MKTTALTDQEKAGTSERAFCGELAHRGSPIRAGVAGTRKFQTRYFSGELGKIGELVDVTLTITHTYNEDLDVFLIHPDGTRVELFTDVGFTSDNFTNTTLDDQADDAIAQRPWTEAPFTGRYRPEGLLSTLNGKNSVGVWKLEITDDERHDQGTLNAWSLTLAPLTALPPTLSIDDVQVTEGDSGTTVAQFTVTRSGDASQSVSVDVATADGTATAGSDYVAIPPTTLTFAPGVPSLPVSIVINGDSDPESDETFLVDLSNPVGATLTDAQGIVTILDDDGVVASSALFVYDISFESKRGGKDWRAVFEIRSDSDADGIGETSDAVAAGVEVTVTFAGQTYTGTTDANGVFRTSWKNSLAGGHYYANAVDLALAGYSWNPFDILNLEDDSDGDGKPDDLLSL